MSIYQYGSGGEEDEHYHDYPDIDNHEQNDFNLNDVYSEYEDIEADENASYHIHDNLHMHDVAVADSTLTTEKIDILAIKLGRSWKRFARMTELFSEGEIYDIEYSFHSIYERCYQMVILWERKSKETITITMVTAILMVIQRNDLARDLIGKGLFSFPIFSNPMVSHQTIDCLCSDLNWSWKRYARKTGLFSEVEINNIDEEETDLYEKCHKMLMQWQEKSVSAITLNDVKSNLLKTKEGIEEKVIRYTVDNGNDIRKIKVRFHHALEEMNNELINIDKNLSLLKVQYIDDHCNGDTITCDNETQLDLAIFDENVRNFNVVTKRKWWIIITKHVRTL